jgi:hypothetical protein
MAERRHYNNQRRPKKPTVSPEQAFIEGVVGAVWGIFKFLFGKKGEGPGGESAKVQAAALAESWGQVELHLLQEHTRALAISEGDKILDAALKLHRVAGQTMGERLKAAEPLFASDLYQQIWVAHKLRNQLAHEVGASVSANEASQAVAAFRSALYHLSILS